MRKSTALKRKSRTLYVKKRQKKVRAVLLTGLAVVFLGVFFLLKSLIVPVVSAYSSGSKNLKDKDIYSTLIVKIDQNSLIKASQVLIFHKKDKKMYSVSLPVDIKLDLPGKFGEEEYQKIFRLGKSVGSETDAIDLLLRANKNLLKLNLDSYIITQEDSWELVTKALFNKDLALLIPWEMSKFLSSTQHNFSSGDLFDTVMFARGLDSKDVEMLDYKLLPDWGLKLRDITLSGDVAKESLGIVVLNGTGKPNIAGETSIVFQNMGARISLTANAENEYEKSYVVTDNPLSSTVKYIKSYYPDINIISRASAQSLGEDLLERGDICVIIGFDILSQM